MKLVHSRTNNFLGHKGGGKSVSRLGLIHMPFYRGRLCTTRYMLQAMAIVLVIGFLTMFQVSLMSAQTVSSREKGFLSSNSLVESETDKLDGNFHAPNQNSVVGADYITNTRKNADSHITNPSNSASQGPETSGSNYNYLYNDGDSYNDNPEDNETETTRSNNAINNNGNDDETGASSSKSSSLANPSANGISKSGGDKKNSLSAVKSSSHSSGRIKNGRRNKLRENSHYQERKKLLESVFLSVKTTKRFHTTRLEPILKTWFNLAREQTWIFTDADDPVLDRRTNNHIINTHCPSTHYRQALCCKMSAEFDTFLQSQKSWFCHVDDDNYVNVPALLDLLSRYDPKEHWYLGKPSLKSRIHFYDPDSKSEEVSFWFGTGGAGFCLSRSLALRMSPLASGGKFTKLCDKIQLPDDVTIGYVAGHLLGQNLTVIPQFHSHFETMKFIDMKNPHPEITFSYVRYADHVNILDVQGYFTEEEDPTRFLSLHCRLFPNFSFCPKGQKQTIKES